MRIQKAAIAVVIVLACSFALRAQNKPKLTLDEFFNVVDFPEVEVSPDGHFVVIDAERAAPAATFGSITTTARAAL